jgi:hypothetical protein
MGSEMFLGAIDSLIPAVRCWDMLGTSTPAIRDKTLDVGTVSICCDTTLATVFCKARRFVKVLVLERMCSETRQAGLNIFVDPSRYSMMFGLHTGEWRRS